ncbi:DUF2971 domain-containing protein [Rhodospirillum rubrum]|uniref:DUF2971 domain-containing protein n=1 Tax=Rhodospirillum rubrum TaxID=1085 RepID=UPI0028A64D41|nr:DUF2971 domain-containing protein [Rhodospirillum rubrum]
MKIIDSKEIWLSDACYMNDSKEIFWSYDKIEDAISNFKINSEEEISLINRLKYILEKNKIIRQDVKTNDSENQFATLGKPSVSSCFIGCFSSGGDILSQWRAYADDGQGVAIGFDPVSFGLDLRPGHQSRDEKSAIGLCPVVYDRDQQIQLINEKIKKLIDDNSDNDMDQKCAECAEMLLSIGTSFKNNAFSEEKEWRIIHRPVRLLEGKFEGNIADIQYRASAKSVIPYIPFSFNLRKTPPILEIILGPKNDSEYLIMKDFLNKSGFTGVKIKKSKASYR